MSVVLEFIANHVFGIILSGFALYVFLWYQNLKQERYKLNVDTVNLMGAKINSETQSKQLDDLIADSNTKHGVSTNGPTQVLKTPGGTSETE